MNYPGSMTTTYYVGRWRSDLMGVRTVLVRERGGKLKVVVSDYPVSLHDHDKIKAVTTPITERDVRRIDYPVRKAAKMMLRFGRRGNITKAARQVLRRALKAVTP